MIGFDPCNLRRGQFATPTARDAAAKEKSRTRLGLAEAMGAFLLLQLFES